MAEVIKDFIVDVFGDMAWLGILIIAMIPIIELRGAIPFALSQVWGASKLTWFEAYSASVIGATIPAFIIVPLLIPIFNFLKKTKVFKKIVEFFETNFSKKSEKIKSNINEDESKNKKELKKFIGVMTFVAIPFPLTGSWTGSAVAAFLKMNPLKAFLAIFLGNIISGAIMTFLCVIFPNAVDAILYVFIILAVVVIIGTALFVFIRNRRAKTEVKTQTN